MQELQRDVEIKYVVTTPSEHESPEAYERFCIEHINAGYHIHLKVFPYDLNVRGKAIFDNEGVQAVSLYNIARSSVFVQMAHKVVFENFGSFKVLKDVYGRF